MDMIRTIHDYYRSELDGFRSFLRQQTRHQLAGSNAQVWIDVYLGERGLPLHEVVIDDQTSPEVNPDAEPARLFVYVTTESLRTLELVDALTLNATTLSSDFARSKLVFDRSRRSLSYPTAPEPEALRSHHRRLLGFVERINMDVRSSTPGFLEALRPIAEQAIREADAMLKRDELLTKETGFRISHGR